VRVRNPHDFLAGLIFILIGAGALWIGWHYPAGRAVRMSAGDFPRVVSTVLAGLGAILVWGSLGRDGPPLAPLARRPLVMVPTAVVVFGISVEHVGFVAAAFLMTLLGSFAHQQARWGEALVTAVVLTGAAVVIFIWALGLSIPLWPAF
jgi:hypothetical protein